MLSKSDIINLDSPKNVIIEVQSGSERSCIELVQGIRFRKDETKKPIYGFKQKRYNSVLDGKTIISGSIVLKKYSKESILNFLQENKIDEINKNISRKLKQKVEFIYAVLAGSNSLDFIDKEKKDGTIDNTIENKFRSFSDELIMMETINRIKEVRENSKNKNFSSLLDLGDVNDITISIKFLKNDINDDHLFEYVNNNGTMNEDYVLNFKNVQFTSKETTIDVDETDVTEVYSFIANLE